MMDPAAADPAATDPAAAEPAAADPAATDPGGSVRASEADANASARLPRTLDLIAYSLGSTGMGVWVTVPGLLLLFFLTDMVGVPAAIAGLTMLLPKIVDIIVHPLLGSRSDGQARRLGHRRRMMLWGLLLGVAMVGMFAVPAALTGWPAALWVGGWFVAGNLLFATFQVPYLTTPSDLAVGYHARTRTFMFRMLFLTAGLLGAGIAAPAIAHGGRGDYIRMAVILSIAMLVSAVIGLLGVRRLTTSCGVREPDAVAARSTWSDVRAAMCDRDFRALVLSYLFTVTTTHLFMAGLPFYSQYVFGKAALTSVFMGAFLAPALLAGPVWMLISRRIGKQRGLLISQGIFVVGSAALLLGAVLGLAASVGIVVVLGVAFAGLQLFAFSMVPDAVAAAHARGASRAGSYTGVWTATEASGTAIGPYLYAGVLAIGGFVSVTAGQQVQQSDTALSAVLLGFTIVPAALMVIAALFQGRYRLDRRPRG